VPWGNRLVVAWFSWIGEAAMNENVLGDLFCLRYALDLSRGM